MSFLWYLQGLALKAKSRDLGMCRLRTADIRDGWHGDAQQLFAVANLVSCRAHHHQPFQRHVSAATSGATWPWQLQDGVGPPVMLLCLSMGAYGVFGRAKFTIDFANDVAF